MIEVLRHFLGLCGEHSHPNIFHLLLGGGSIGSIFYYLKYNFIEWKNKLKK